MLLDDLCSTRICDKLLVPEADEEVRWGQDLRQTDTRRYLQHDGQHRNIT